MWLEFGWLAFQAIVAMPDEMEGCIHKTEGSHLPLTALTQKWVDPEYIPATDGALNLLLL